MRRPAQTGAPVSVEGLSKRYGSGSSAIVALDGVSLAVGAGSLVALSGPSGSGKSTLLHLIGAMDRADEGRIAVGDVRVSELSEREAVRYRRRIGFVFQRFHLLPALSALENVVAPLLALPRTPDRYELAREALVSVGLEGREDALPSELSGGQQQRVAIARALVVRPMLLLADEPTGNLDSTMGAEIFSLIRDLQARYGVTAIVASHDLELASRCDRMLRLRDGQIVDDVNLACPDGAADSDPATQMKGGAAE
jgi:putative ABC transport system ATP-binding protein